jgi:hypothetical protein
LKTPVDVEIEIIGSEVNENALAENFCAVPLFKTKWKKLQIF